MNLSKGISASLLSGSDWVAKVVNACALLPNGGVVTIDDDLQGNAATIGTIPSNITLVFTGTGQFGLTQLNVGAFTKIYGCGAKLTMLQPNLAGISMTTFEPLQTDDTFVLSGLRISGGNLASTIGVLIASGTGKVRLDFLEITQCNDSAIKFTGAQFVSSRKVHLYNNVVGLKNYGGGAGGGGNSNKFSDWSVVGNNVGAIFSDLGGPMGMGANVFKDSDFLSNGCAVAVFGSVWPNNLTFMGGSPEHNDPTSAPATTFPLTIDGNVIPLQTAFYCSKASLSLCGTTVADAVITPWLSANNGSTIVLRDVSGYGNPSGQFVDCDASSTVFVEGAHATLGSINNVASYPNALLGGQWCKLIGAPYVSKNPYVPNLYAGNPVELTFGNTLGAVTPAAVSQASPPGGQASSGYTTDPLYGPVATVTHAPVVGSQDNNRFMFGSFAGTLAVESDVLVTLLLKASVACTYAMGFYGDNTSQGAQIDLPAGQWQKVVMLEQQVPAGSPSLVGFPRDTSGATIQAAFLEVVAGPTGTPATRQLIASIVGSGSINTNGN
jgi:hypothetical protein